MIHARSLPTREIAGKNGNTQETGSKGRKKATNLLNHHAAVDPRDFNRKSLLKANSIQTFMRGKGERHES